MISKTHMHDRTRREAAVSLPQSITLFMLIGLQGLNKVYNDFEKTKGKLETVLDTYQMKMELHKKLKKRTMVQPHMLLPTCLHIPPLAASQYYVTSHDYGVCHNLYPQLQHPACLPAAASTEWSHVDVSRCDTANTPRLCADTELLCLH